jgi:3-oxoacyl-[acyl-carrier protein] reductase
MKSPVLRWEDIAEGMEITLPVCVSDDDMRRFARLSGDVSPLHTDPTFARSKGYEGIVVYGGLLVSYISRLVGMHVPGRDSVEAGLEVKFANPLYVNENATLSATVKQKHDSVRLLDIAFRIATPTKTVALGVARVLVR